MAKKKGLLYKIKKSGSLVRNQYWRAKSNYIKYVDELPINETAVLLESQNSTKADGNMFYLLKYMCRSPKYSKFKFYFSSQNKYKNTIARLFESYGLTDRVEVIVFESDIYTRLLASAKYLMTDATFPNYFIKKPGQVYLNTWHGTPLKAMGKSVHNDVFFGNIQKNFVECDYLLYPNEFTKDRFIEDYMISNIASCKYVLGGYPRNEIFFDNVRRNEVREQYELEGKKVYAYMPTWRGTVSKIGTSKNDAYLLYYICELDKLLGDDEILYVNLHPMALHAKNDVNLKSLEHIRRFPNDIETYDFLNAADVLITDYSSVFFDYACSRRKIVLFPYDKDEYLRDRGMYLSMDEDLPFPQVYDQNSLVNELRSPKNYDDTEFIKRFCSYDGIDASEKICDFTVLNESNGLTAVKVPDNGKENVLIYAGILDQNGLTTSLRSLINTIDLDKRNYYISFCQRKTRRNGSQLKTFNPKASFFAVAENFNLTALNKVTKGFFDLKMLSAKRYRSQLNKRFEQNFIRAYGHSRFDYAIQFCGYETDMILLYSAFKGKKTIFVHNDMIQEIKTRQSQRKDVLKYAYDAYDNVVTVSEDIVAPTVEISGRKDNIHIVHNTIDYKTIIEKSEKELLLDPTTKCSVEPEKFYEIMRSDSPKFINIGRYSPEKGHDRLVNAFYRLWQKNKDIYLIIMGGNSREHGYENLCEKLVSMGLENNVILLLSVSNPYPVVKACDYFIMSSFYEGLPMVLFEAELLGLPIAATDVKGPHGFLTRYGGTLVENSEEGVYDGLNKLLTGEAKTLGIDYDAYNRECVKEFEALFD